MMPSSDIHLCASHDRDRADFFHAESEQRPVKASNPMHIGSSSFSDGNANLTDSMMLQDGYNDNRTEDESATSDGGSNVCRRSNSWIMNNLMSTAISNDGAPTTELSGSCSGVVWVETVESHPDLLVNSPGQCESSSVALILNRNAHLTSSRPLSRFQYDHLAHDAAVQAAKTFYDSKLSHLERTCSKGHSRGFGETTPEEPIHMTLDEVRLSLHGVKQSSYGHRESSSCRENGVLQCNTMRRLNSDPLPPCGVMDLMVSQHNDQHHHHHNHKKLSADARCLLPKSLKHTLCHWLGLGKGVVAPAISGDSSSSAASSMEDCSITLQPTDLTSHNGIGLGVGGGSTPGFINRALPPLPVGHRLSEDSSTDEDHDYSDTEDRMDSPLPWWNSISAKSTTDFASSIQKVKDYGWYWGPISGQAAEAILANEPDGSFVVRDSSDEHYIFSLTFKLDGLVRHVRIEHDHGNFSFGTFTKFKSNTIVEFIENAVQHSRSGRYLFFLHRRPVLGPMRVQLLHPVSRFKQVQSLQHMCRFVILKVVRRDLIDCLPLPNRLKDYLDTLQYYSEESVEQDEQEESSEDKDRPV